MFTLFRRHWFLSNMEQAQSNQQSPRMPCFGWASTGSLGKSWGCLQISWNIRKEKYCKVGLLQSTLLKTHAASEIKSCTVGTLCGLKLTLQPLKKYVLYSMNVCSMNEIHHAVTVMASESSRSSRLLFMNKNLDILLCLHTVFCLRYDTVWRFGHRASKFFTKWIYMQKLIVSIFRSTLNSLKIHTSKTKISSYFMCAHCDRMLPVGAAMWHHPTIWGGAWCSHRRVRRRQQESPDPQTSHDAHSPSPWQPDFCFTSERRNACSNNHTCDSLSMLCVLRLKDTWKILCYHYYSLFFFACSCIYSMWFNAIISKEGTWNPFCPKWRTAVQFKVSAVTVT